MENEQKKYTGSCYIGVIGSENESGECRDSIDQIQRRSKDDIEFIRATKGFEARQLHLNNWIEGTKHPFALFLDSDMKFPTFTLERLRSWKLPYISGAYMRRRYAPMAPVWYDYGPAGQMPMQPFTGVFLKDQLYKIGASGWGCILVHRDVVTAMRPLLKGEPEIIEDDMDVYPYDLTKIMQAIKDIPAKPEEAQKILLDEIRPLRGLKDFVGSDIRFPFYARLAGFDLYLDTGVNCEHMINYPMSPNDFIGQSAANIRDLTIHILKDIQNERERIQQATKEL